MYYDHFGLNQPPFRITPNTEFFFGGGNRGAILEALIYAITHGEGIVKVTGEVGSGKTMLCSMLQARLSASVEAVYLANPSVAPEEVLHAIAFELQLGVERDADRLTVMHALQDCLVQRHAEGKRVVVFIEESQSMPIATLEEIRLLSNLETRTDKLLQIVMFGQPELDENLRQPNIRQLRDRIAHSFRLEPLTADEVREYLTFRMRAAGYRGPEIFPVALVKQIARASNGLTRRVNLIADKALLAAFSENTHTLQPKHIESALRDSEFHTRSRLPKPSWRLAWTGLAMGFGVLVGAALYASVSPKSTPPAPALPVASAAASSAAPATLPAKKAAAGPRVPPSRPMNAARFDPMAGFTGPSTLSQPTELPANKGANAATPVASSRTAAKPGESAVRTYAKPALEGSSADSDGGVSAGREPQVDTTGELRTAGDLMGGRLAATQRWLAKQTPTTYSIQLFGGSDDEQLKRSLNNLSKSIEINKVFVYRTTAKGKPFLTVLYGSYGDREAAQGALADLPGELKAYRPLLRTVQGIRREIEAHPSS